MLVMKKAINVTTSLAWDSFKVQAQFWCKEVLIFIQALMFYFPGYSTNLPLNLLAVLREAETIQKQFHFLKW